jgi:hypothetical protein
MKIDPDRRYTPKEVAEFWILSPKNGEYTVRSKIRRKELNAINVGTTKRPIYRVLGSELLRYEKEHST